MADYRFFAEDIVTGQIKTQELLLSGWSVSDTLNRPGSLTASLSLSDQDATEEVLSAYRTAIYLERDGLIEWGGILMPPSLSIGAQELSVQAIGWLGYWDRRIIRTDYQPDDVDQFLIVQQLVADAQDEVVFGDGYDLGITVGWSALSGVTRVRTQDYRPFQAKNLGDALRNLAALESGFDYSMTYTVNAATDRIDKEITLYYPRKGRDTGFMLKYDRNGQGGNVIARGFADQVPFAWVGDGWGSGADETRLSSPYIDATLRNVYPPFDAAPSWTSVTEQTTLDQNTEQWFRSRNRPRLTPVLRVDPDRYPKWGDWELGDTVNVDIVDGYGSTNGPQTNRITGWTISDSGQVYDLVVADPDLELSV